MASMPKHGLPDDLKAVLADCAKLRKSGTSKDGILGHLRGLGKSKTYSILVIQNIYRMSLRDAKEFVHLSPTWADMRADDDEFHDLLERIKG